MTEAYADSGSLFTGTNENGEEVFLSVAEDGLVLVTNQANGWIRVNYYDAEGDREGESFSGRWK